MSQVFLLLGSNLGDREGVLFQAREYINSQAGSIVKSSALYETEPWGNKNQPGFLNQVLQIETNYSPAELLAKIGSIEKLCGRIRDEKWGPRTLDIDILYFSHEIVVQKDLKIPHPGISERRFTLIPLVEIAPDFIHPIFNVSNKTLLERCKDHSEVKYISH